MKATRLGLERWAATILVTLTLLFPATAVRSAAEDGRASQPPASRYVIQVGSFPRLTAAEDAIAGLREKGCDAQYRFEDTGSKGMWYRVYTGNFETLSEARQAAEKLKADGVIKAYLVKKVAAQTEPPPDVAFTAPVKAPAKPLLEQETAGGVQAAFPAAAVSSPAAATRSDFNLAQEPEPEGPRVRLSLMEAIRYTLQGNREIKVTAYDPLQAQADMESSQSVYDPLLFADANYRRDPNLDSSIIDIVTEDDSRSRAGILCLHGRQRVRILTHRALVTVGQLRATAHAEGRVLGIPRSAFIAPRHVSHRLKRPGWSFVAV